ncbi:MAG TPA: response regulator [Spirochaetia bacterium]|nr:response regulator [Spirochaetia bacterium]
MKKRVLVVDDEEAVIDLIRILLVEAGYEVATAENGRAALDRVKTFGPELVITDITMPDMEGIELMSRLRKSNKGLPIIAMSGNAVGMSFLKATKLFGAVATLLKPFSNQELLEVVEHTLSA